MKLDQGSIRKPRVVFLCGQSSSSRIMYHGIASQMECMAILVEDRVSGYTLAKRRASKLGYWEAFGQIVFILTNKIIKRIDKKRCDFLLSDLELQDKPYPKELAHKVKSVNSNEVLKKIAELAPDIVIVNGTRIIGRNILKSIRVPIVNTHLGITPRYRGVHGGYWAAVNKDLEHFGVTVHMVDSGIDTGGVLYQASIVPSSKDTFNTYPIIQISAAIPLMLLVLKDIVSSDLNPKRGVGPSKLWHHPTIWQFLKYWLKDGCR